MSLALLARIKDLETRVEVLERLISSLESKAEVDKPKRGRPPKETADDAGRKADFSN